MISELTKEQEAKIPYYFKKWEKVAYEYRPINQEKAKILLTQYCGLIDLHPTKFIFLPSPMACQLEINKVKNPGGPIKYYNLNYYTQCGNIMSGYCAFYDFLISEVKSIDEKIMKVWDLYKSITEELHYFFIFKDDVFLSEKPKYLKFKDNVLHADLSSCVEYEDGFALYCLNGVTVTKEIAMTPAETLDSKLITTEKNAEVRREIVRKIGIERICRDLNAKVIERSEDELYELLLLDLGDNNMRPYLKMRNPSIGVYHIEGVPPGTNTIKDALHSRKPPKLKSIPIDDINGDDWYQQGDVCTWNKDSKSVKSYPKQLT